MKENDFEKLLTIDVRPHIQMKQNQKFLSWTYAWTEFKKVYPDANYRVIESEFGIPYVITPLGIIVKTEVTANGETIPMHLPVMNGANRAMKDAPYEYKTKSGMKHVEAATMMDINKSIMRCLVKNIAMFGLGMFIYNGEDQPEVETIDSKQIQAILDKIKEKNLNLTEICKGWQLGKIAQLHEVNFEPFMLWLESQV